MSEQEKQQATLEQEEAANAGGQAEEQVEVEAEVVEQAEESAEAGTEQSAELERQLNEQRKAADENYQRYLRTQADFDNFRRRSRQEKEDFAKYASAKLIEQLLPVIDNFERALSAGKTNNDYDALLKGVDMIYRLFDQVMGQEGLKPIESVGQPFNPEYHQAIMQVESADHPDGTVLEELQKGYILKDKVLRPAMVKVSGGA
ncbi:MAG: co-chaperone GrpE [Paenibacillus sp.]|nr:co-chaperone GrpE [Paenibacillus sp.]